MEIMNNLIYKIIGTSSGNTMMLKGTTTIHIIGEGKIEGKTDKNDIKEEIKKKIEKKIYLSYRKGYEKPIELKRGETRETLDEKIKDQFYNPKKVDETQEKVITQFQYPKRQTNNNNPFHNHHKRKVPPEKYDEPIIDQKKRFKQDFGELKNITIQKEPLSPISPPSPIIMKQQMKQQVTTKKCIVSDAGWGCMLRSAQMMMAEVYRQIYLTTNFTQAKQNHILRMFMDKPNKPYSIHQLAMRGELLFQKQIGKWFGPAEAAELLQQISKPEKTGFVTYVASSSTIVRKELKEAFKGCTNKPLLLLLPCMMGLDQIHRTYYKKMIGLMRHPQCMGFIGGKPNQAMYFMGVQGDNFFALDPHKVQLASSWNAEHVHTNKIRQLNIKQLDPCVTFGFLLNDEQQLNAFYAWMIQYDITCGEKPLFAVRDEPIDMKNISLDDFAL
mmetsp:Transcript_7595/g.11276  ORF Transcript_7595/g.11276 Transcript_7595/m.11276 type:complete len:442 (+) Transcript_7595:188-1513(+)